MNTEKEHYCGECGREVTDHRRGCLEAAKSLKGVLTPERRAIFDGAIERLDGPAKLRTLAEAFDKEGLGGEATALRIRASLKEGERVTGKKRELGTVRAARKGKDPDKESYSVEVLLDFDGSAPPQCFEAAFLQEGDMEKFAAELLATLGKKEMGELEGTKVNALRPWDAEGEPIEGLEHLESKRRFTKTSWLRRQDPAALRPSPFEERTTSIAEEIARLRALLEKKSEELTRLESGYTDWEHVP